MLWFLVKFIFWGYNNLFKWLNTSFRLLAYPWLKRITCMIRTRYICDLTVYVLCCYGEDIGNPLLPMKKRRSVLHKIYIVAYCIWEKDWCVLHMNIGLMYILGNSRIERQECELHEMKQHYMWRLWRTFFCDVHLLTCNPSFWFCSLVEQKKKRESC